LSPTTPPLTTHQPSNIPVFFLVRKCERKKKKLVDTRNLNTKPPLLFAVPLLTSIPHCVASFSFPPATVKKKKEKRRIIVAVNYTY
jgi:hypothetical protein